MILVFISLNFLPEILRKKDYAFDAASSSERPFPLDETLKEYAPGKSSATLRTLLKQYPKGLLVNFWATWCPPCLEELPSLENLGRQLQKLGKEKYPQLLTVSVDEKTEEIQRLLTSLNYKSSLPVFHDPLGKVAQVAGTTKFPETYWLSSDGKLLHKWVGPQNWNGPDVLAKLAEKP